MLTFAWLALLCEGAYEVTVVFCDEVQGFSELTVGAVVLAFGAQIPDVATSYFLTKHGHFDSKSYQAAQVAHVPPALSLSPCRKPHIPPRHLFSPVRSWWCARTRLHDVPPTPPPRPPTLPLLSHHHHNNITLPLRCNFECHLEPGAVCHHRTGVPVEYMVPHRVQDRPRHQEI